MYNKLRQVSDHLNVASEGKSNIYFLDYPCEKNRTFWNQV